MSARFALLAIAMGVMSCISLHAADAPLTTADQAQFETLGREFPSGTSMRVTPHFIIIYDVPDAFVDSRVHLLEMTRSAFFVHLTRDGFNPKPPTGRLVCILFKNYHDYLAYSKRTGAAGVVGSGGYYAANTNRIAIFDNRSNPNQRLIGEDMERVSREITEFDKAIDRAGREGDAQRVSTLSNKRSVAAQRLGELQSRHTSSAGLTDIAQTIHEATHQFAFNSGVQQRGVAYPFWLSEGLATSFETTNPALAFGPGQKNPHRQQRLVAIAKRRAFMPLRDLVAITTLAEEDTQDKKLDAYAQAWSLFQFLYTHRLPTLRTCMQKQGERRGAADAATFLREFEAAFGPLDKIENEWRGFVAELRP